MSTTQGHDIALAIHASRYLPDVCTVEEIERVARVPKLAIILAIRDGLLGARDVPGAGWRITRSAVLSWLDTRSDVKEAADAVR